MTTSFDMIQRERKALAFIQASIETRGFAPSFAEIQNYIGVGSKSTVAVIVAALEAQGKITRNKHQRRGIAIVSDNPEQCLPADLQVRLRKHCAMTGDTTLAVMIDAITEHLDETEPGIERHNEMQARAQ